MKKSLALVLVLAMVFALAAPAFAATAPTSAALKTGISQKDNVISYTINLETENTALCAFVFHLNYDTTNLKFLKAAKAELIEDALLTANAADEDAPDTVHLVGACADDVNGKGLLMTVTFELLDEKFVGDLEFKLEVESYKWGGDTSTEIEINVSGDSKFEVKAEEDKKPDEDDKKETEAPKPGPTGGITLVAVAVVSAVAGLGALGLRRKED